MIYHITHNRDSDYLHIFNIRDLSIFLVDSHTAIKVNGSSQRAVFTFHYYSTIQSADNPDKSTRLPYHFNRVTLSGNTAAKIYRHEELVAPWTPDCLIFGFWLNEMKPAWKACDCERCFIWLPLATFGYLSLPLVLVKWLHFLIFGYLWLPLATFGYIWLPFLTFGYHSLPFFTFPYLFLTFSLPFPYLSIPFLTFPYLSLPFLTFP